MEQLHVVPSQEQAQKLKELSQKCSILDRSVMEYVFARQEDSSKVSLPAKKIRSYFPESYTGEQIQEIIYRLLEEWRAEEGHRV